MKKLSLLLRAMRKTTGKILKYFYLFSFWVRKKDIFKFDEAVKANGTCFTIELEKAGFTDQLIQFIVLYNLGTALNLKFAHTKLSSPRSFTKTEFLQQTFDDVYDFLGLNRFLAKISHTIPESQHVKTVVFDMENDSYFFNRGIAKKEYLLSYLKLKLHNEIPSTNNPVLIRFRLKGHSSFFKMFSSSDEYWKFPYDLRMIYNHERKATPQGVVFRENACPLFVHIRQGDTAVLETPWNTYVYVRGIKNNAFKEFLTFKEIQAGHVIHLDHYYSFIKDLLQCFNTQYFSARIYSDGFKRTFQSLYNNREKLGWSDTQIKQLKNHEITFDEKSFKKFTELGEVKTCIGEENSKLYELIHSVLHAKVVIIGTQQRMIPKLLSVYCDPSNMPLVIVLTNKNFSSLRSFGREDLQPFYMTIDVNNYNSELIAEKVRDFLQLGNEQLLASTQPHNGSS